MNDRLEGTEKKQSIRPITERKSALFERGECLADEFTVASSRGSRRGGQFSNRM